MGIEKDFWPFKKARAYVRKLNIQNQREWGAYCRSGGRPETIPTNPQVVYKNQGWLGYRDWLRDTKNLVNGRYKNYRDARKYVRSLKLSSYVEWLEYAKSGKRPRDIPATPRNIYAGLGWIDFPDFLGIERTRGSNFLPFEEAREFVHQLGLKNKDEWYKYIKSGKLPINIPTTPSESYKGKGYISFGDWIGTGFVCSRLRTYRSFEQARAWVRKQKLKTRRSWVDFTKSGALPDDIPITPEVVYKDQWKSYPDWLGSKNKPGESYRANRNKFVNRDFKSAREFVRSLKLKSQQEWKEYLKSGDCPIDIPSAPASVYADEWAGYSDWLGNGNDPRNRYRPDRNPLINRDFKSARAFARQLNLKSKQEWIDFTRSEDCPLDIPTNPWGVYKEQWISIADWLAINKKQKKFSKS